jgi:hypothetical protein
MNWNQALALEMIFPQMSCNLIIVGEDKESLPFCYEDSITLQQVDTEQIIATIEFQALNPLEPLHHIGFIEISFRERGMLYYAFIDLLDLTFQRTTCILTLSIPQELRMFQNQGVNRIELSSSTSLSCKVISQSKPSVHEGITFSGLIHDITANGLSFITATRIFYPLLLELTFVLPKHPQQYVLQSEIIRVSMHDLDSYWITVEFRNISERNTQLIDDYCSRPSL